MLTTEKPIAEIADENKRKLATPYYLIDEQRLERNLKIIDQVRKKSGAKAVLALKCFSTWSVFDLMRNYLDGTTSSSLFEARLGHEKFGKETHAYCVGYSDDDIPQVRRYASKIIFNSISQLKRYHGSFSGMPVGLRINPGVSHSNFDLANPARRYSRLGVVDVKSIAEVQPLLTGAMFHCQCENANIESFSSILDRISADFGPLLKKLEWVSLGGGIAFTSPGYPLEAFCEKLSEFARKFDVQVYLEPGEAAVTNSSYLVTQVVDVVHNEIDIAIVDAAVESHLLDLLIYNTPAKLELPISRAGSQRPAGTHRVAVAGRTCLAGDVFGTYDVPTPFTVGDLIPFADAAGYSMVKKNWFNGVAMPSIVVRRLDGKIDVVRTFGYEDYRDALS